MNTGPGLRTDSPQELEQTALGPRKNRIAAAKVKKARTESKRTDTPESQPPERSRRTSSRTISPWLKELRVWGQTLVIAVLIVLCMNYFVFSLSTVEGQSMQPTLYNKEWLFVNKISYLIGKPRIGDVVILKDPAEAEDRKEYLVKRIVAGPGERIEIRNGELYRNGELVMESYTDVLIEDPDYGPVTVPADHYFVMGDNRHVNASRDSRSFQAVPRSSILGHAELILWPITKWAHL